MFYLSHELLAFLVFGFTNGSFSLLSLLDSLLDSFFRFLGAAFFFFAGGFFFFVDVFFADVFFDEEFAAVF